MHWFWRAVIAVVVAASVVVLCEDVIESLERDALSAISAALDNEVSAVFAPDGSILHHVRLWSGPTRTIQRAMRISVQDVFPLVMCLVIYGLLTRTLGPKVASDGHIRCRKCNYILRGLTEPRCPECGERI